MRFQPPQEGRTREIAVRPDGFGFGDSRPGPLQAAGTSASALSVRLGDAVLARSSSALKAMAAFWRSQTSFNQLARWVLAVPLLVGTPTHVAMDTFRTPLMAEAPAPAPAPLPAAAAPAPSMPAVAAVRTPEPVAVLSEADLAQNERVRAVCSRTGKTVYLDDRLASKASSDWKDEVVLTHPGSVCAFTSRFGVADPNFRTLETNTVVQPAFAALPVPPEAAAPLDIRPASMPREVGDPVDADEMRAALAALGAPTDMVVPREAKPAAKVRAKAPAPEIIVPAKTTLKGPSAKMQDRFAAALPPAGPAVAAVVGAGVAASAFVKLVPLSHASADPSEPVAPVRTIPLGKPVAGPEAWKVAAKPLQAWPAVDWQSLKQTDPTGAPQARTGFDEFGGDAAQSRETAPLSDLGRLTGRSGISWTQEPKSLAYGVVGPSGSKPQSAPEPFSARNVGTSIPRRYLTRSMKKAAEPSAATGTPEAKPVTEGNNLGSDGMPPWNVKSRPVIGLVAPVGGRTFAEMADGLFDDGLGRPLVPVALATLAREMLPPDAAPQALTAFASID